MKQTGILQGIKHFLGSMRFGVLLLSIIIIFSFIGSIVPQGRDAEYYYHSFGNAAQAMRISGLTDIFNSVGFLTAAAALIINLMLCSISRVRQLRCFIKGSSFMELRGMKEYEVLPDTEGVARIVNELKLRISRALVGDKAETACVLFRKNTFGYTGSWFVHAGVFLMVLFLIYGQLTFFTTAFYGVPGTICPIEGTDYRARIDDYTVAYGDDGVVQQYSSKLRLIDKFGMEYGPAIVSVNNPLRFKGYSFYQASEGWAVNFVLKMDGSELGNGIAYSGMVKDFPAEDIGIELIRLYPDFYTTGSGFFSRSDRLDNPRLLYCIYYRGQRVDMNIAGLEEKIIWNEYEVSFDKPQKYTYIQVNRTKGTFGAFTGAVLLLLGMTAAFYMPPLEMAVVSLDNSTRVYVNAALMKRLAAMKNGDTAFEKNEKHKEELNA